MADLKSAQDRFTQDRWQAGRIVVPGRGGDEADTWVIDVVVVEEAEDEDLRAIARYRPNRGMTPDLGPVMERAIREPVDGLPHLPAVVRVATPELAAEIRKARPEVRILIGPTPLVEELGLDAAEEILPSEDEGEESWQWLTEGIVEAQVKRLFAAMDAAMPVILEGSITGGNLLRLTAESLGFVPGWLHVTCEPAITGGHVVAVAIAPDRPTRDAWDADESAPGEIAIYGIDQDELSPEAYAELGKHGLAVKAGYYPRVTAGGEAEAHATAAQIEVAIAALESIAAFHGKAVKLSSGAAASIELAEDEFLALDSDEDEDDEGDEPDEVDEEIEQFLLLDGQRNWAAAPEPTHATVVRTGPKIGRNDPCHCGSGLKYKKCHG